MRYATVVTTAPLTVQEHGALEPVPAVRTVGAGTLAVDDLVTFDTVGRTAVVLGKVGDPDAWRAIGAAGQPAFLNSWTNYGSGYTTARFRRDPHGRVYLAGLVKGGSATSVFTLPVGYRPSSFKLFTSWAHTGAVNQVTYVQVRSDTFAVEVGQTGAAGGAHWASLEGVSFDAEQ